MNGKRILTSEEATALADTIRATHPEKAREIDAAVARDGGTVSMGISYRLEKFHGEMAPGDTPYEVIEGQG